MKKMKFKKISAILSGVLVAGLTVGTAAAASYPAPFVDNGVADVGIVYGTGTGVSPLDHNQAESIQESLAGEVTGGTKTVDGDSILFERSTDKFNLGEDVTDFYSSLYVEELSTILADEVYLNDNNDNFDYEQKITLSSNLALEHFRDRDYEDYEPTIGFHLTKGENILNYTLEFTPNYAEGGTDFEDMESTFITLMNKEYYVSKVEYTGGNMKLTLLDSANSATINEGETKSLTVGDKTYDVSIGFIGSDTVRLVIDGEETNSLEEGQTYKLSDGTHVAIQAVLVQDYQGGVKQVEFSLGTGEMILENGQEVEINGDTISSIDGYEDYQVIAHVENDSTDLKNIVLEWNTDDDVFLTPETELILPGFESVKLTMGDLITDTSEKVLFNAGDPFSITTEIKDGDLTLDLFYLNSSEDGFGANLGSSEYTHLITNSSHGAASTVSLNLENETYFVTSWSSGRDSETYAYELSNIKDNSGKNETTLKNLVSGSTIVFSDVDKTKDVGRIKMTLTEANVDGETATIKVEPVSGGSVYTDRIFTSEGLRFLLPVTDDDTAENYVELTNDTAGLDTTWSMNFTEEDVDGNIAGGSSFLIDFSIDNDDGIEADGVDDTYVTMLQVGRSGDDYVGYVESELATRIDWTKDSSGLDAMEITYHGSQAYVEAFLTEVGATITTDALGDVLYRDTELAEAKDMNLIIVGGSCINSAAATVLGGNYCGEDFTDATGVGEGEFLIKGFQDAFTDGKLALVVAGYEAQDTVNAATYLMNEDVDTSAKYIGTSSTQAELIVE